MAFSKVDAAKLKSQEVLTGLVSPIEDLNHPDRLKGILPL